MSPIRILDACIRGWMRALAAVHVAQLRASERGCAQYGPSMASRCAHPPPDARTFGYSCSPDARIRGRMRLS
eukprot:1257183-Karenia_brevis.AAC.1